MGSPALDSTSGLHCVIQCRLPCCRMEPMQLFRDTTPSGPCKAWGEAGTRYQGSPGLGAEPGFATCWTRRRRDSPPPGLSVTETKHSNDQTCARGNSLPSKLTTESLAPELTPAWLQQPEQWEALAMCYVTKTSWGSLSYVLLGYVTKTSGDCQRGLEECIYVDGELISVVWWHTLPHNEC